MKFVNLKIILYSKLFNNKGNCNIANSIVFQLNTTYNADIIMDKEKGVNKTLNTLIFYTYLCAAVGSKATIVQNWSGCKGLNTNFHVLGYCTWLACLLVFTTTHIHQARPKNYTHPADAT